MSKVISQLDELIEHHDEDHHYIGSNFTEPARAELASLRAESAGRLDALNSWAKLWAHICTVMGCADYLPSEQNFDAMLEKARATVAAERERADNAEYALKSEHGQLMAAQKKSTIQTEVIDAQATALESIARLIPPAMIEFLRASRCTTTV